MLLLLAIPIILRDGTPAIAQFGCDALNLSFPPLGNGASEMFAESKLMPYISARKLELPNLLESCATVQRGSSVLPFLRAGSTMVA